MGTDVREELDRLKAEIEELKKRVTDLSDEVLIHRKQHESGTYLRQMEGY